MDKKLKPSVTYVTNRFDAFVVLMDGLAYWFKMKNQYLYWVTTEEEFFQTSSQITNPTRMYHQIPGSIITIKVLLSKRAYFATHPVNEKGLRRKGVELCPEFKEGGGAL